MQQVASNELLAAFENNDASAATQHYVNHGYSESRVLIVLIQQVI